MYVRTYVRTHVRTYVQTYVLRRERPQSRIGVVVGAVLVSPRAPPKVPVVRPWQALAGLALRKGGLELRDPPLGRGRPQPGLAKLATRRFRCNRGLPVGRGLPGGRGLLGRKETFTNKSEDLTASK